MLFVPCIVCQLLCAERISEPEPPVDPTLRLVDLDLNLLLVLHVILEERSVSRAAVRLGRTQSATSRALARLREALGDPLLVRTGRGMRPTPRAEALAPALAAALAGLAEVRALGGRFDPARSTRRFVVAGPDALAPVLHAVWAVLRAEAPRCGLALVPPPSSPAAGVLGGGADLVLGPDVRPGAELRRQRLGTVRWLTVLRADHPLLEGPWTLERWCAWPHAQVQLGTAGASLVDRVLGARGARREVLAAVPGMLPALHLVARTDLVATVPEALARPLAVGLGLVLREPPLVLPETVTVAWWAPRLHADPGHRWLRRVVVQAAREVLGEETS